MSKANSLNIKKTLYTKVCIIGAGPAGATTSLYLSKKGISHIILDKAEFPRDKICGDGLTIQALHSLKQIKTSYLEDIINNKSGYSPIWSVKMYSPKEKCFKLYFNKDKLPYAPVYTARRYDFDNFLVENLKNKYANVLFNTRVTDFKRKNGKVLVYTLNKKENWQIQTNLVVGADGMNSVVNKKLGCLGNQYMKNCFISVRAYYKNIYGIDKNNSFEFYFLKCLLPGYLWIFPLNNKLVNVGIITIASKNKIQKLKLVQIFKDIIQNNHLIAQRFKNASKIGEIKGWRLPLNLNNRLLAGDNFILLGDAGSLVESFLGEGVGIAMQSAKIAAEYIQEAIRLKRYDKEFLIKYNDKVNRYFKKQWLLSKYIHKAFYYPWIANNFIDLIRIGFINRKIERHFNDWLLKWMKNDGII